MSFHWNPELGDFLPQGVPVHAQEMRGLDLVAVGFLQRMLDEGALDG